jgi:hypothetical protein
MNRRFVFLTLLVLVQTNSIAQTHQDFLHPQIWLRTDNLNGINSHWYDCSGSSHHAYQFQDSLLPPTCLRNFNPVFNFNGAETPFTIQLELQDQTAMTLITAYRTSEPSLENGVWSIRKDSLRPQILTSQKISGETSQYTYRNNNDTSLLINSYCFSLKKSRWTNPVDQIMVGGSDRYGLQGQLAEFICYPFLLSNHDLHIVQSYLCLKYGVRLQGKYYISSKSDTLWNSIENNGFNNSVIGIGKDTLLGLNQKQSTTSSGSDILTMGMGSIAGTNLDNPFEISEGDFLVCGNNNQELNVRWEDSLRTTGLVQRQWLIQATGTTVSSIPTCLVFNLSSILEDSMSVQLLICRDINAGLNPTTSEHYMADSVSPSGIVYFYNIHWDVDNNGIDLFTLMVIRETPPLAFRPSPAIKSDGRSLTVATGDDDQQISNSKKNIGSATPKISEAAQDSFLLYPNPSEGDFTLDVLLRQPSWLNMAILDSKGQKLEMMSEAPSKGFHIQGNIQMPGNYFLEITTESIHKAIPFIVQ